MDQTIIWLTKKIIGRLIYNEIIVSCSPTDMYANQYSYNLTNYYLCDP